MKRIIRRKKMKEKKESIHPRKEISQKGKVPKRK